MKRQGQQTPLTPAEREEMRYPPQELAQMLSARRLSAGLTLRELGDRIRVSPRTLANYEAGEFPLAAARVLSWLLRDRGKEKALRARAERAETTLRDVQAALARYREAD